MKLFTWEATLLLALIGWVTALYLLRTGRSSKYVMLPAYFAVIEVSDWTALQVCIPGGIMQMHIPLVVSVSS